MPRQTNLNRWCYFGRKFLVSKARGLGPSQLRVRFTGPKVLINSIPKAGTNLIENCLDRFPVMRNSAQRTLRGWECTGSDVLGRLRRLKRGEFATAHLPAHKEVLRVVEEEGIKVIFIIRDPRDVIVSNFRYVTNIDTTHPAHKRFQAMANDRERLRSVINGIEGLAAPIDEVLELFGGWLKAPNTLVVRFEDLIGPGGGGSKERQTATIKAIAGHLDIALSEQECGRIAKGVYSTKTLTYNKGALGAWREHFTSEEIELFNARAGALLKEYGY